VRVHDVCEAHHPLAPTVVGDSPAAQALVGGGVAELRRAGVTCEGAVRATASASPASTSSRRLAVASHASKPVVVPPKPHDPPPAGLHRVSMPLDGTPDTARAVEQAMRWFAGSGVAILSLHVVDAATVPRF
jgi:hypothetical protein